jgi:hypothetical protein
MAHVVRAATLLLRGVALKAEQLAAQGGSCSQVEIRRSVHALGPPWSRLPLGRGSCKGSAWPSPT